MHAQSEKKLLSDYPLIAAPGSAAQAAMSIHIIKRLPHLHLSFVSTAYLASCLPQLPSPHVYHSFPRLMSNTACLASCLPQLPSPLVYHSFPRLMSTTASLTSCLPQPPSPHVYHSFPHLMSSTASIASCLPLLPSPLVYHSFPHLLSTTACLASFLPVLASHLSANACLVSICQCLPRLSANVVCLSLHLWHFPV
jgi:hypothetical protein